MEKSLNQKYFKIKEGGAVSYLKTHTKKRHIINIGLILFPVYEASTDALSNVD